MFCLFVFLSFWLKMGEGLLDLTRCCEVFLWNQALYSDRIRFLTPKTMCIPFKYLTFTLLTASISCKLMIFLGTWVNILFQGAQWWSFPLHGMCLKQLHFWSNFSATCWIWTSGLEFGISVPLTTNALIQTSGFHCTNYGIHDHEVSQWGIWSWNGRVSVTLSLTAMF